MLEALRSDNSPFNEAEIRGLQSSFERLNARQATWLSGYLAGKLANGSLPALPANLPDAEQQPGNELHVIFASQTGNGEQLAGRLAHEAGAQGIAVRLLSFANLRPPALKKIEHAAFIISTHGEGDPPDDALELFDYLQGPRAPRLEKLNFRILALGDSTYSRFCEAGRMLEELLLARGAVKTSGRVDCDLDYEPAAELWSAGVIEYSRLNLNPAPATAREPAGQSHLSIVPAATGWSRKNPFPAMVERVQKITGLESGKDVFHLELSLEDSGLRYQPGDSLGVWAPNAPETVAELLRLLDLDPAAPVGESSDISDIAQVLTDRLELTRLSADVIRSYAKFTEGSKLETHFESLDEAGQRAFIESRQFIDLVQEYPARLAAGDLAALLRPLASRSYSIASSRDLVDEDVHLTVASLYSNALGIQRTGVASHHLNRRLQPGDEVRVFLEPNRRFRLPEDRSKPLILIAAGTGIAPYRAFMQQLEHENATTDTWLIYGNPSLRTDFLYQREWLNWRSSGLLTRIDCAWSRDQQEKRYVQHLVAEHIEDLARWLDRGASVYLCGGLAMGQAVEQALCDGLVRLRGIDTEVADSEIAALRRDGRLLKDLY